MKKPKLVIREVLREGKIKYYPYLSFPKWFGLTSNNYGVCSVEKQSVYSGYLEFYGVYESDLFDSEVEAVEGVKQFLLWRISLWNDNQKNISMKKNLKTIEIEIPMELINEIEKTIL